jgi:hypothetical protein
MQEQFRVNSGGSSRQIKENNVLMIMIGPGLARLRTDLLRSQEEHHDSFMNGV